MNTSTMIEKKVGEIADRHTKALASELHVRDMFRSHMMSLNDAYGVDVSRPDMAAMIHGMADSILSGVKVYVERISKSQLTDALINTPQGFFDMAVAYAARNVEPELKAAMQRRDDRFRENLAQSQAGPEIMALIAKDQADERQRIMETLEDELAEIQSRPDRKN
ncbi:MAG: hypothetical protein RLZZ627_763 [Pseudomonadota bacterium]|jgi:hypothetical protein